MISTKEMYNTELLTVKNNGLIAVVRDYSILT